MEVLVPDEFKTLVESNNNKYSDSFGSTFNVKNYITSYQKREEFRTGVSWHIPTKELIQELIKYAPLVSVCSGFGYTESLLKLQNIDIIATDIEPNDNNGWCKKGTYFLEVEQLDSINAVIKYSDRNVFMAWPPYNDDTAYDTVKTMSRGKYLIYIGENRGGCNGTDDFFSYLDSHFEEITDHNAIIPQWKGLHDYVSIYKKIKN